MKNETPMGKDDRWDPKKLLEQRESDDARAKCNETLVPQKQRRPNPIRRLLKASLYIAAVAIIIISVLIGCTTHPSHIYADRVFVDCGHTYRAYRNDRAAIITHDGGCTHPMHRCRDTVYHYGVTE